MRAEDDPLTYAYLKALGRRIGVEMSVNTSFNVAGPIAQTPSQAIDTLRRSKGLDVVLLVASDGSVHAAWHGGERDSGRFTGWLVGLDQTHGNPEPCAEPACELAFLPQSCRVVPVPEPDGGRCCEIEQRPRR